jgi:DNA-directed RNA polymerase specialized sigma subunit
MSTPEYASWLQDPTPENMSKVVNAMDPMITAEIHRYSGPKPLLRSRAKSLAIKAIKTYKPDSGAQLQSWVVTQLQPLARYGQSLRPIHSSEMAVRQAAEIHRVAGELSDDLGRDPTHEELADHTGLSVKRIANLRKQVRAVIPEATFTTGSTSADPEAGASLPGTSTGNTLGMSEEIVYNSLNERDKAIYDWKIGRHGKPRLPNQEIAKRLGVTPALISQRSQLLAIQLRDLELKNAQ